MINSLGMGVWKGVNNCLCLIFSNAGLNDDQNLGTMPTIQLMCMVMKSYISCPLAVPCNHLHGGGVRVEIVILESSLWTDRVMH